MICSIYIMPFNIYCRYCCSDLLWMDGLTSLWIDMMGYIILYHGDHPSLQRQRMKSQRRWIPVRSFHPEDHGRFSKKDMFDSVRFHGEDVELFSIHVLVSSL